MVENLKIGLLGIAGLCYVIAAVVRWYGLSKSNSHKRPWALLALGLCAHLSATVISFVTAGGADFAYSSMGSLLAALAMLIGTRFLSVNSPGLLLLPVGLMALLVAIFATIDSSNLGRSMDQRSLVFYVHIIFMSANLAAVLLASAAAGMYLVVSRQLKTPLNAPSPTTITSARSFMRALITGSSDHANRRHGFRSGGNWPGQLLHCFASDYFGWVVGARPHGYSLGFTSE